jgi:surfactin synthase thioesterase subunit
LTIKKVFSHRTLANHASAADIGTSHSGNTESINENAYPPLFCVHGQPLRLTKHLHDKRSLFPLNYVYQVQNLVDMPTSIEQLASVYIDKMRVLQPAGPYYLFGFSAGGTVAYEIANQLIASGESIGHLCLVEPTVGYVKSIEQVRNIYADMKKIGVSTLGLKHILQIFRGVIKRRPRVWVLKARTFFHEKTGVTMPLRLLWVNFLTRLRPAMRDYRYPVLKCNVDIMYCESDENTNKLFEQFWLEKLGGECSFHTVKGARAHLDLMEDAALKECAELLDSAVFRQCH